MRSRAATAFLLVGFLAADPLLVAQSSGVVVRKQTDPITDEDRSGAFLSGTGNTVLAFRCMADGLNVQFGYGKYFMGSDSKVNVVHRFPPAVASDLLRWDISTNNEAAFLPMSQVSEFVKHALANETVVLRATDRDGDQVTAQFKLVGLATALSQLPCHK